MAGMLTQEQMDVLEKWINAGPKAFTLLFKITRDGCDSTTFHQKCDRQGPTLTVLNGADGTLYGGYTVVCWSGSDQYHQDDTAFLYRLQYRSDISKRSKYPVKPGDTQAMHCYSNCGPLFGSGHDLYTFNNTIQNTGGQFKLDGYVKLGTSYDTLGMTSDDLNGGSMVVTELEVYGVAGETYTWVVQHGPVYVPCTNYY